MVGLAVVGLITGCGAPSDDDSAGGLPPSAPAGGTTSSTSSPGTVTSATASLGASTSSSPAPTPEAGAVRVGAAVLAANDFERINGLRVGVVLNQASMVDGTLLLDLLAGSGVDLVAAFAPEHGLRADAPAGQTVSDSIDEATGVPVYSLYGDSRSPPPETMAGIDLVLFDLQDVGARFYTYVSTMGLTMQAAADAGIPFMVLDRPNPLGGQYVAGYRRAPDQHSFIGQYPMPAVHGLTTGELAMAIKGESWLDGLAELDLRVVPMDGWQRGWQWPDTGLTWYPPSPGLPTDDAATVYPGTVLFESAAVSAGQGTTEPYTVVGAPWVDRDGLAAELNGRQLPGVHFEPVTFTPEPTASVPSPPFNGQALGGVRIVVDDPATFQPVETGVQVFWALAARAGAAGVDGFVANPQLLDRLAGTDELRLALEAGASPDEVIAGWSDDVAAFVERRQPYLLYGS